ncbi:MFS transporter [Pontibaca methylaminivorans]|uniref:MFS transporter, FSR family, fosmidomycin resistance protein n=1 Tax=Pontibaca methylaminivorans TaxID=515897 RepID=A0A1R3WMI6_9RHOB|nr:MFS transporter [Pontibaca methylaminivorans]SIT79421.1 MFS transporter, FSR family, fosmidomycin resistance protein [Pontibaca methylaminivorans]
MTNPESRKQEGTAWLIILGISMCHMLNDVIQSLLQAIYPLLRDEFALEFWQIGLMTFAFRFTASLLQPLIGLATDRRPFPYSLPIGMGSTMVGLILLASAHHYSLLLAGAALIGLGSSVFHPEASRVARLASGGRFGMAQSLFQVGGNFGTSVGPLLAAFIVVPFGRGSIVWFSIAALLGIMILSRVSHWYARLQRRQAATRTRPTIQLSRRRVVWALVILTLLVFTKNIYIASMESYYIFFLIERFDLSTQAAQLMMFLYLGAMALGVAIGGMIGDRVGSLTVIWVSILGVLPFTLMLPYANLFWTGALSIMIGVILASAFPAIVVFAQELVPGRVGMVAGMFFGLAFGMAGIAAAVLGVIADRRGIDFVYHLCSFLPLLGLLTIFLPRQRELVPEV